MGGYSDFVMEEPESGKPVTGVCHARGGNADLPAQWLVYFVVPISTPASPRWLSGAAKPFPRSARWVPRRRYALIEDPAGAVCTTASALTSTPCHPVILLFQRRCLCLPCSLASRCFLSSSFSLSAVLPAADDQDVDLKWGVRIPLRDGVELAATVYRPAAAKDPLPVVFTLTPYIGDSYHPRGRCISPATAMSTRSWTRGDGGSSGGELRSFRSGGAGRLRRRRMAGPPALVQRQGGDVGRLLRRSRSVGHGAGAAASPLHHRARRRRPPGHRLSRAQEHLLFL